MQKKMLLATLASSLLLASCASAPHDPSPDPVVVPQLPALDPPLFAQEPDFTETMRSFLSGSLTGPSKSATSGTPTSSSTSAPAKP